jgi:Flp pilus assembly protein TadD
MMSTPRRILLALATCCLAALPHGHAAAAGETFADVTQPAPRVMAGPNISATYLHKARSYREAGRYELARQSYLQALATCQAGPDMEATIREELGAIELLIRTMR